MNNPNNHREPIATPQPVFTELDLSLIEETAGECDFDACNQLLKQGANVNVRDETGCTPLLWAVLAQNQPLIEILISKGSDLDAGNEDGETPIHWAAMTGNLEIAKLLIELGADVNARDNFDITPLRTAVLNEDRPMAELLRKYGGKA